MRIINDTTHRAIMQEKTAQAIMGEEVLFTTLASQHSGSIDKRFLLSVIGNTLLVGQDCISQQSNSNACLPN